MNTSTGGGVGVINLLTRFSSRESLIETESIISLRSGGVCFWFNISPESFFRLAKSIAGFGGVFAFHRINF